MQYHRNHMIPCNTMQYNTLPLSGNKSVHCHQSPHQPLPSKPPALLLLSFSCHAAPAASHCQGAESPPNRNGGIMGKWCSIHAGTRFKYFIRVQYNIGIQEIVDNLRVLHSTKHIQTFNNNICLWEILLRWLLANLISHK